MAPDALDRARSARNLLERIGARVPGFSGYLERELRREVDQRLRAELADRLDAVRRQVMAHCRGLKLGEAARLDHLGRLEKRLDGLANRLRHAGSGYAGLFDAVKVREEQLELLYRHDLGLVEGIDGLFEVASGLYGGTRGPSDLEAAIEGVASGIEGRDAVVKSVLARSGA